MAAIQLLRGHQDSAVCMAFNASSSTLASGAEDGRLLVHDLKAPQQPAQACSLCSKADYPAALAYHPLKPHLLVAAAGCTLHVLDTRQLSGVPLSTANFASDDIGSLAIHRQGTYVATADDAGDVMVASWTAADALQPYKCLTGAHQPLAAGISFRPQRPWELLSAGMDCCCKRWDFSRGRALHSWNMAAAAAAAVPPPRKGAAAGTTSSQARAEQQQQGGSEVDGGQLWNPPWVYGLAVPRVGGKGGGLAAGAVAIARGDGVVTVLDASSTDDNQHAGTSSRGDPSRQDGETSLQQGYRVDLGRSAGGHRKAAAAVEFLHAAGGSRWLVSGGEDGLVLLWDWQAAWDVAAAAAAADVQRLHLADADSNSSAGKQTQQQSKAGLGTVPTAGDEGPPPQQPCRLRLVNKHKVNAVCSASLDQLCFAMCDTSRVVKLYTVRSA